MYSYRAINLLPNIFEKVIIKNILQFCEINKVIPDNQFGFRKDHFTYHAMIKLASDISLAMNGNYVIGAILIELKSAFDSVWLNGLLYKLDTLNFPVYLQKIVWMLLKNIKCYVESTFNKEIYTSKMYNLQMIYSKAPLMILYYFQFIFQTFCLKI